MLDAEAVQLCGAGRYERSEARQDTPGWQLRATLQTSAGESVQGSGAAAETFETAIIETLPPAESSVEEALIEMYLAGISVRRVEDITEALGHAGKPEHGLKPRTRRSTPRSRLAEPADRR